MSYNAALGNPGDFFYHYTSREAAFGDIVPRGRLRLSPAFKVGDPLEAKPALLPAAMWVQEGKGDEQAVEALAAGIGLQQLRRCSKVLSLTIDANDYLGDAEIFGRGYSRARMWEQYAERHAGVCLMYSRSLLAQSVPEQIEARSPGSWRGPVRYTQRGILDDAASTLMPSPGASTEDTIAAHIAKHHEAIFFTKLTDWESEHEYRFVERSIDEAYSFVNVGDALVGIILGHAFPSWQTPGVFDLCDRVGAQPWQMSWELSRPSPQMISPVASR